MKQTAQIQALDTYFKLMSMKGAVEVFHTAQQNGILELLSQRPLSGDDIADSCILNPKATKLLLKGLLAIGVVNVSEDVFHPAPVMALLQGTYQNLSSEYWEHLPQYLKTGTPMQLMDDPAEGKYHYETQAKALYWMMRPSAIVAAQMLGLGNESGIHNILDVGAGSAVWSISFAEHLRDASVTAVDWPNILKIAQRFADSSGIEDKFTTLPGDYRETSFENNAYNLIIVANVVHLETEDAINALLRRLKNALMPQGQLLIIDVFHDQPDGELNAAIYELGLALRTENGRVHDKQTLITCLQQAGFSDAKYHPIIAPPHTMGMIITTKEKI